MLVQRFYINLFQSFNLLFPTIHQCTLWHVPVKQSAEYLPIVSSALTRFDFSLNLPGSHLSLRTSLIKHGQLRHGLRIFPQPYKPLQNSFSLRRVALVLRRRFRRFLEPQQETPHRRLFLKPSQPVRLPTGRERIDLFLGRVESMSHWPELHELHPINKETNA